MSLLSKIRAGLLSALVLSTTLTATPANAESTPHTITPSIVYSDVVAYDASGVLWTYSPSDGDSWHRRQVGTGWKSMRDLKITDWNQDRIQDILAVGHNGDLYLYLGAKTGGFTRTTLGTGWGSYNIEVGQWKASDLYPSIVAADLSTGILYNYPNPSGAALAPRAIEGRGWGPSLEHHLTDFDSDGKADILAQQMTTGDMLLYRTDGAGNFIKGVTVVGKGWEVMNEVVAVTGYSGGDMICDCRALYTHTGLLARANSGALYHYGFVSGAWAPRDQVGTGWNSYTIAGTESPRIYTE